MIHSNNVETVPHPAALPDRPADGNKGTFGRLLIVGGNDEMIGAPVLAGMAALRTGAGLVQVALPKSVLAAALSICPELIGMALSGPRDLKRLVDAAAKANAIVVGPGLGQSVQARQRLRGLASLDVPIVVDADALNMLAAMKSWPKWFKGPAVLTPHPGEMRRLARLLPKPDAGAWLGDGPIPADDDARIAVATAAAKRFGHVIVLKGKRTVVTDDQRLYLNHTGDSTLAKAGSGDILSGILGCLLGQRLAPFDAATLACWLHGKAGEVAGATHGRRSTLGREVIDCISRAIDERQSARG